MYARAGKRVFDLILALLSTLILIPLLVLVSVLIWVSDPGPLLFVQQRVGRHGKTFTFYKFRSMPTETSDMPSDQLGKIRLTWIGRLIRRTNIDELPQLLNIVLGDMSLVGPRPAIPQQDELLELRKKNTALSIRPGLTGLAQVNSYDGMSVEEKARFDGEYARAVTLWHDFSIILRTIGYLFKKPPVY